MTKLPTPTKKQTTTTNPSLDRGSAWMTLIAAIGVTLLLPHVPLASLLARPLVWLSTLAHEGGHGVAAVLVGGTFTSLQIFPDASGVAHSMWDSSSSTNIAVVSLGGLLGPAVCALVLLWMGVSARLSRVALVVAGGVCAVFVGTVTTGFATIVTACWGAVFVALAVATSSKAARLAVLVLAVELWASVYSRADYLFVGEAHTGAGVMPSDVAQIATALGGHHLAWGVLIALVSVVLFVVGVAGFMLGDRINSCWRRRRGR